MSKRQNTTKLKLVEVSGQKLTTTSLIISELFGRPHKSVLRSLDKLISRLNLVPRDYVDSRGKSQRMYILDERSFLIAMPFIGGNKAEEGQVALVDEFLRLQRLQSEPNRKALRDDTKSGFRWMNANLKEKRERESKESKAHHFMNEAKLINGVLTGNFSSVNRDSLSSDDLHKITELQRINANLIAQDVAYYDRKKELQAYFQTKLELKENPGLYLVK